MALSKGCLFGLIITVIIAFFLLLFGGFLMISYNKLVNLDEGITAANEEIENQLQRRYDLIPNLVNTVKGYASHEKELFEHIADARARLGGAGTLKDKLNANTELGGLLSRLLMIVENYPQLKANENFIRLQDELAGTENRIAVARGRYIRLVKEYNSSIRRFPTSFVAGIFNFEQREYIEVPEEKKEVPEVDFGG